MIADSRCWVHRAAAGGNCDLADDTENGRIRLCIDAGSSQDSELMGTAARETPASRAAVPKFPAHGERRSARRYVLSGFFRFIREIAVPTDPARRCLHAKPGCHSERSREAAQSRNRDHTGRAAPLSGQSRFLDSLPLARNDSPAVLQFLRRIVVPTGPRRDPLSG
jgi:hypothetical protein